MEPASSRRPVGDPAPAWSQGLQVEVGGAGTVAQAGVVLLPRLLADRLGLTAGRAVDATLIEASSPKAQAAGSTRTGSSSAP